MRSVRRPRRQYAPVEVAASSACALSNGSFWVVVEVVLEGMEGVANERNEEKASEMGSGLYLLPRQ